MRFTSFSAIALLGALVSTVTAQLSGTVGPTTTTAHKAGLKVCNILNYGGSASATFDNGPAILAAWNACKTGGEVYIPAGNYGMATWVTLNKGTAVSINLVGTIYRTGTAGGHMFIIENTTDFEFYSATSKGAIQGYGYKFHTAGTYGPRLLRLVNVTGFSVHDIALVDSPAFHLIVYGCTNGDVYNMIIRGGNEGGLDGVDVSGTNIHIHDLEVTNKDECVTVKNPSSYMLIENIYCNWSGGSAIGSLSTSTNIHHITYKNIYTSESNQMMMLKSNGGDGTVHDIIFENFIGHKNAYSLNLNAYWSSMSTTAGNGISYHDLTFSNWKGTCANGAARGPVNIICPTGNPCYNIKVTDFSMWTESGKKLLNKCQNAYGSGGCLKSGTSYTSYAVTTQTVTATPTSYAAATMAADLTAGFGLSSSIPIPTIPTSFFPGATPAIALLG